MKAQERVDNMSNEQLKCVWNALKTQSWGGSDIYDGNTSMDDWGMMISVEMDSRGLSKF